ncbi:DUF2085 domain-containing protein [Bacillus sp. EB106-08-02-XG196]|uniref:DUF2085 domain-containing protein n=1 Tax=Bacillus sp. EB106-08-02-XG196 TaxID=2737049 RepID=UPI0015C46220|nr:DUF2085 domain-containing protein [Bacillus sp. EB106-08-02-XG196]
MLHEILHFFGRAICHQLEERSLTVSGEVLAVCARDTGIYIGIFSTLIYLHFSKRKQSITIPSIKVSFLLLLFLVPLIIDGLGSYLNVFESTNVRRLVTGTLFGFVLPYFIYPLLSKQALDHKCQPVLNESRDFYLPLLLSCLLGGLFYWGNLPSDLLNGIIIFTIIVWFSLCASFLFSSIRSRTLKLALSVFTSLAFLSLLSVMHSWITI